MAATSTPSSPARNRATVSITPTPEALSFAACVPCTPSMWATMITRTGPAVRPTTFREVRPFGSSEALDVDRVPERGQAPADDLRGPALVQPAGRALAEARDLRGPLLCLQAGDRRRLPGGAEDKQRRDDRDPDETTHLAGDRSGVRGWYLRSR